MKRLLVSGTSVKSTHLLNSSRCTRLFCFFYSFFPPLYFRRNILFVHLLKSKRQPLWKQKKYVTQESITDTTCVGCVVKEEDAPMLIFETNTVENQSGGSIGTIGAVAGNDNNMTTTNHFNPIEKITELYERLLSEEKAKNEQLQQRLLTIEEKLEGIR